jgi:GNAT superfamily N-acetyltransferase
MKEVIARIKENLLKSLGSRFNIVDGKRINIILNDCTCNLHLDCDDFVDQYNPEELSKGQCNIVGKIEVEGEVIGAFRMREMIGCAAILIFSDMYVIGEFRSLGVGRAIIDFVTAFSKHFGFSMIEATDVVDRKVKSHILQKSNWDSIATFDNPKTKNKVNLWVFKVS